MISLPANARNETPVGYRVAGMLAPALPVAVHGLGGVALEDGRFYFMLGSTEAGGVSNPGLVQILEPASPQD